MTARIEDAGDEELLRRAGGEAEAFAVFYRRYERLVVGWLMHQTRDAHVAADLAAEVLAAAYVGRDRYRADAGNASAWLIGIAQNKLRLSARRREIETRARAKLGMERVGLGGDALADLEALHDDADAWLDSLGGRRVDSVEIFRAAGAICRGRAGTGSQAAASVWRWSLRRLWVAVIRRHSERTAALPLRWKRSMPRLCLVWPKTGSIIGWRWR